MAEVYTPALQQLCADFQRAREINVENLHTILEKNCNTVFGRRYGFADIRSPEAYRERVPLTDYSDYVELVSVPNGVTAYPIACMLASSGTTGGQKLFPLTFEALNRFSTVVHEMPFYLMDVQGMSLHVSVFRGPKDGKMLLSSAYHNYLKDQGAFERTPYAGGTELLFSDEIEDVAYLKAWLALSCPELVHLQSVYLYDALLLFGYIEKNWQRLLSDMRSGHISGELTQAVGEKLLECRPTEERIRELQEIFSEGFDWPIAGRLWKKLRMISGIGGRMFALHEAALKRYIGELPVCHCVYGASECVMGVPLAPDKAEYALLPRAAHYEFRSLRDDRIVGMDALEVGGEYGLVLTTFSGLYRYAMADILKVTSFIGETPVVEISGRIGNVLNVAGEKLDEASMREAIRIWTGRTGLVLADCAAGTDLHSVPGCYYLFIESAGTESGDAGLARAFDEALRSVSPEYDDVRKLKMLEMPRVQLLPAGAIRGSREATGVVTAHSKPKVFLSTAQTDYLIGRYQNNEE